MVYHTVGNDATSLRHHCHILPPTSYLLPTFPSLPSLSLKSLSHAHNKDTSHDHVATLEQFFHSSSVVLVYYG